MNEAYLLTGGNIGDRLMNLQQALARIEKKAGPVLKTSDVYETAAWGLTEQESFLNQVLLISTALPPLQLLHTILGIEQEMGRKRKEKMGPRIIDIDILFYGNELITLPGLTVPHPQIANRRFVLTPLCDIAPRLVHPQLKKTVAELLEKCPDKLEVQRYLGK